MINISKPSRCMSRIFLLNFQLNKTTKRNYNVRVKDFDKQSYLNKKIMKGNLNGMAIFTLSVPITCFGLAVWQVYRLRWKNELVQLLEERTKLPAIELPEDLTDRKKLEYRKVRVRGTFDHSREIYLSPRSKIVDNKFINSVLSIWPTLGFTPQKPNIGAVVITPFKVAGRDIEILVNRGWIPADQRDPATRLDGQIEGEVELEGIIRLKEEKPSHISEDRRRRLFSHRDIQAMAEMCGTTHFYIDATVDSSVPGGPLGGQTQVKLKNDHFNYICTWMFIGVYTLWMWHKRWIRRLH